MLRLRLQSSDFTGTWRIRPGCRVASDESWIAAFEHPALQMNHHDTSDGLDLVVREQRPGGDHVRVVVTERQARLEAGLGGAAPLYLTYISSQDIASIRLMP